MKFKTGINHYIIHLPQTHADKIKLESGVELYVDPTWNPQDHRILKAELVLIPQKEKILKVGDIVHFHPNIVNNKGFHLGDDYYAIPYNADRSLIPAYEHKDNGFTPLFDYLFVKQEEKKTLETSGIFLGDFQRRRGFIAFMSEESKRKLPCTIGDEINYRALRSFTINVNGEDYIRLLSKDVNFVYAEEEES